MGLEINWVELLPYIIPSAAAIICAAIGYIYKVKTGNMAGEISELILVVLDAVADGKITPEEVEKIIDEGKDVAAELKKLLDQNG